MHEIAALVTTVAFVINKPRIRSWIKVVFGKSLFIASDLRCHKPVSIGEPGEKFAFLFEKRQYSTM